MATRIWINRSGLKGQIDSATFIGFGFGHPPGGERRDLSTFADLPRMRAEVLRCYPDYSKHLATWRANRWLDFVHRAEVGELAVMTLKRSDRLRLGVIVGEYRFDTTSPFHRRDVEWKNEIDRPPSGTPAAKQIGKRMAFFPATNELEAFLRAEFVRLGLN